MEFHYSFKSLIWHLNTILIYFYKIDLIGVNTKSFRHVAKKCDFLTQTLNFHTVGSNYKFLSGFFLGIYCCEKYFFIEGRSKGIC